VSAAERRIQVRRSDRCFRLRPGELAQAPRRPGVYEFLAYGRKGEPEVLYVGLALERTLYDHIADHLMGNLRPSVPELRRAHEEVFFDFLEAADGSADDLKDIAGELMIRHNPRHNLLQNPPSSGRHRKITLMEL